MAAPSSSPVPTPSQGMALVFWVMILLVTAGMAAQGVSVYPGLLLTEVGLLLVPTLLACRRLGLPPAEVLGLRPPAVPPPAAAVATGAGMGLLAFGMAICLTVPVVILLLILGGRHPGVPLPLDSLGHYLAGLALGAVVAPVCEELLFRGFLLRALAPHGLHASVWVSAAAFGLFHLDPVRFVPTLALGVVYGYLTVACGSIYPAMAAHGVNNFLALTLGYLARGRGDETGGAETLTYEGLREEMLRQARASGLPGDDPEALVRLLLAGTVAALLAAGLALAGLLGIWLWGLGRRAAAVGAVPDPPAPLARLAAIPWLWGIAGVGAVFWTLVLWSYWGG